MEISNFLDQKQPHMRGQTCREKNMVFTSSSDSFVISGHHTMGESFLESSQWIPHFFVNKKSSWVNPPKHQSLQKSLFHWILVFFRDSSIGSWTNPQSTWSIKGFLYSIPLNIIIVCLYFLGIPMDSSIFIMKGTSPLIPSQHQRHLPATNRTLGLRTFCRRPCETSAEPRWPRAALLRDSCSHGLVDETWCNMMKLWFLCVYQKGWKDPPFIDIHSGITHWKWWCSIAMLN